MDLSDLIREESLIADKYIYKGEPFKYLDRIYDILQPTESREWWINRTLDFYSWLRRNDVDHDREHYALYQAMRHMINDNLYKIYEGETDE